MDSTIKVGKIAGVQISINLSLLFIAALIIFSLAGSYLPYRLPESSKIVYWVLGTLTATIFFFSILWHEMAHALMAKFFGLPVKGIVLNIIGGMAYVEKEPKNANQTFWFAFVGPLSSAVFGVIMLLLGLAAGRDSELGVMFMWLGQVNLFLAAVNMLPGLPLDGGHVFLSIIWYFTKDQLRATYVASKTGQGLGVFFIAVGVLQALMTGAMFAGLWSIFIGVFIWSVAKDQLKSAKIKALLRDIPLRSVINPRLRLNFDWSVMYALDMMSLHGARHTAPVIKNDKLVGVFLMDSIVRVPRLTWGYMQVGQLMRSLVGMPRVSPDDDLLDTLRQMELDDVDFVLVAEGHSDPYAVLGRHELMMFAERRRRSQLGRVTS